jgi:hypothetical protein
MLVNQHSVTIRDIQKERPQLHRFESVNTHIDVTIFSTSATHLMLLLLYFNERHSPDVATAVLQRAPLT